MLFGEYDNLVPAAVMGELEKLAPGIQLALLRDVAHVPFVSTPDLFTRALLDFYRDHGVVHAEQ
jgi:pimeloyl-[acyl-carrier protein] methyl ester esterase